MSRKTALVFAVAIAAFAAIFTGCRQQAQTPEDVLRDWYGKNLFISEDGGYYWSSAPRDIEPGGSLPQTALPITDLCELEDGSVSEVSFAAVTDELSVSADEAEVVWLTGADGVEVSPHYWIEIYLDGEWYCLNVYARRSGERIALAHGIEREDSFGLNGEYPAGKYRLIGEYSASGDPTGLRYLSAEFEIAG